METIKDSNLEKIKQVSQIQEKGSGIINEDSILVKDDIFGVFDGASSLNKYIDENGKTGGYLASSIVKEIFEKWRCLNNRWRECTLHRCCSRILKPTPNISFHPSKCPTSVDESL